MLTAIKEKNSARESFSSNVYASQTVVREGLGADPLKVLGSLCGPVKQMCSRNQCPPVSISRAKSRSEQKVSRSLTFLLVLIKPNQNTKYFILYK